MWVKYRFDAKICDFENREVFYDKLTYIYLAMPKFTKTIDELETRFEKMVVCNQEPEHSRPNSRSAARKDVPQVF